MSKRPGEAPNPTLYQLQQPEKLRNVLAQDKPDDCLSCRLTGATALIALGAYSYFSGSHQLQKQQAAILKSKSRFGMKSRQAGIVGIAAAFVGMGFWRLVN
ncbi:MAG: exosome complex protein [Lasallia pustulata]|uniref:Exosome complex protein n=1 Tax=Lasallia pustulata TaxID=136370 RepID=A0A5M8PY18_9LECA|nr:MAG: exosome complex protein [Lasallia pustulata]